jgi:hypothetical protein
MLDKLDQTLPDSAMPSPALRATTFFLNGSGGPNDAKLSAFVDYLNSYKALGINTITLVGFVPVDPASGRIESTFAAASPSWIGSPVNLDDFTAYTDAARARGFNVLWKPRFTVDDGQGHNVNDLNLGPTYYPSGNGFSPLTFLNDVRGFWSHWPPVAQQHGVNTLILGTEQLG